MANKSIQVILSLLALISLASAYHTIPGCQPELGICTNACEQIFTNLTNSNFTYMGGNQCTWNTDNASINWTYYAVMTSEGCNDAGWPGGECAWFGFAQIGGDNICPSYNTLGRQVNATDCGMDWNFDATKFNFNSDFFSGISHITTTTTINEAAYLAPIHLKAGKIVQPQQQPTPTTPQKGLLEQLMDWLNSLFT
jgi:hypothetical protein